MRTETDPGGSPPQSHSPALSIEALAAAAPVDPSVLAQWPFAERRRRTTDRRQHSEPRVLPDIGTTNAPDGMRVLADPRAPDVSHPCTVREQQIVQLLMQGWTNKRIAERLGIKEDTVKKHLQHIYDKFGIRRRTLLMLWRAGG